MIIDYGQRRVHTLGNTVSSIGETWEEAFNLIKKDVETGWCCYAQDIIILNPETGETIVYRPEVDEDYGVSYRQILSEGEVRGLIGVSIAGIYGKKPGPGQWVAICYFDI
jgi:hypothetical protein